MELARVIRGVHQTEKGARIARHGQYVLQVARGASKPEIKQAVEALFKVSVVKVNTLTTHGKWRRLTGRWGQRADVKKAVVTVAKDQKIEVK